ncbi:hypothetical protein EDM59_01620 [Brevibacillus nitrificans]|uniref:Uncharacterized protein n=1 Tax=Brevibacillus nitrificans TaxID=651560 RepID=A0A3M8DPX1_9BACL|nr:hypothetical protein [Brevibacillus nitrificans]RNB90173.1 hypothetical protein EDM59_01620 [Brevibacillus nitrificans]
MLKIVDKIPTKYGIKPGQNQGYFAGRFYQRESVILSQEQATQALGRYRIAPLSKRYSGRNVGMMIAAVNQAEQQESYLRA